MRASRLVSLVLLLQARGPWTAEELAERLEVSVRTIHRDVEALRESGVPIRGERGPAGGYRLPGGYRTRLTGLTPSEAEALFVAAPAAAGDLGLGGFLADAQLKLLAALPPQLRERADRAGRIFHVDQRGWFGASEPPAQLAAVAGALWRERRVRFSYRGRERAVDPLGLVLKGPSWYLVAGTAGGERTYRVERIGDVAELEEPARAPDGFDLAAYWDAWARTFEESLPLLPVRVRVEPRALAGLGRIADSRRREALAREAAAAPRGPDGRIELDVWFERLAYAEGLLALGGDVEVLAPPELRARFAEQVAALHERYRELIHPSSG